MHESNWRELCAFTSSVWGRELTIAQKAAGWKLLAGFPDEAVENAILAIAEDGREQLPPWPVVYKAAQGIANAMRDQTPLQLPAGDALSDAEHEAAMIRLRARQTPEQRRRASLAVARSKGLSMTVRLQISRELLTQANSRLSPEMWDALADEVFAREFQLHSPLVPAARADLA